jgi:hypothetical protein
MDVARNHGIASNRSNYLNFNPKWNTKYVDLLASKSYAKVVTSGSLSIYNNKVGYVGSTISYPTIYDTAAASPTGITKVEIATATAAGAALTGFSDKNGVTVASISGMQNGDSVVVYRYTYTETNGNGTGTTTGLYYEIKVTRGSTTISDAIYFANGVAMTFGGTALGAFSESTSTEPTALAIQHAPKRTSIVRSLVGTTTATYGFRLTIGTTGISTTAAQTVPVLTVCENATTVPITMVNTNLIGFNSDGSPRTSESRVSTVVVANNKGEKFVIGGLEKEQVVRSANKVPYLGDIPGLGWVLGNERETHKKSQIVAVIDVIPVLPETGVSAGVMGEIAKDKAFIGNYGVKNSVFDENDYGFDQFLLDSEKKSFDPLP